jgi:hypothetical protein
MGRFANERTWRESRAWAEPETKEPVTDDEFEAGYADWHDDKSLREVDSLFDRMFGVLR